MKYGSVVRLGPNELSFIDVQAWKDIYGHRKAGKAEFTKDPNFFDASVNGEQDIVRGDNPTHSRFRKVFSNSFSDRALKQQESLLKEHVNKLVRNLTAQAKTGAAVDMAKQYNFTTFDIMADLTFSESLGLLDGNDYNDWVRAIVNNWQFIVVMRMLKSYKTFFAIFSWFIPKQWREERLKMFNYAAVRVNRRLERGTTKSDIWDQMQQRDASITVAEMHANAEVFMVGGSETTATLLSGLTYYLLTNPEKMGKLKQEIRTACPRDEDVTVERLQGLKYLHACVEEALRHYSPSVIGHVRIVPEEGGSVCGGWLPGGTKVSVPHYVAYHSPTNFARPREFIPERWIDTDGEFATDKRDILQPFSYGPRNCIGKK
ncbi:putative cytochrome p450 protein [Neofusicoccum parvum]|uniref:Cytochrome p450 protein n=2 Tax=Neofusicoccum parvum TaxID=310453 RepID=A0ACB5SAC9_9PEZI|nr:putative cytochrome p450 protein [Neofusicoccum parvum UCRNP2]GME30678.1 putative cytochrome p450 protein [Neofusicoccum parvum]GME32566.1 putative cytochrome p450 protein [Neofusicoccum parvum]